MCCWLVVFLGVWFLFIIIRKLVWFAVVSFVFCLFFVCVFNRPLGNTSQQKTRPQIASLACFCDTRTLLKTTLSIHAGAVWQQVVSHSAAKNCILWCSFRSMLPPLLFSVVACDTRVDTLTSSPDR